ncbi:MAG: cytochrome c [Gammaproteobacteria bacterium]|nr:cytochrome c [Gammaproteobacteria bacterium]
MTRLGLIGTPSEALVAMSCAALLAAGVVFAEDAATRSVRDGVYTAAQAERGRTVYVAQCEACHKADLRGEQMTPSLVGVSFAFRWNEKTLYDYLAGMRATMPQSAPGGLSDAAYVDVLAYILAENGYPSGDAMLVADADALRAIRIAADF